MAITINTQPTYPNATYTDLVYVVTSNQTTQPQMQYVMDIVSGSTVVSRVRQYPNPAGKAVFNPARIMNDYIEYRTDLFDTTGSADFGTQQASLFVKFGEEYGSSISSSVTVYDGAGSPGSPVVSGSTAIVWPATVDPNNGLGYNWLDQHSTNTWLSTYPTTQLSNAQNEYKQVARTDYGLLGFIGSAVSGTIQATLYNSSNSTITTQNLKATVDSNGTFIPAGPKNIIDAGVSTANMNSAAYYRIQVGTYYYYFTLTDNCNFDRVNFLFTNKWGSWDFYGVNLPKKRNTSMERSSIVRSFIDYSGATSDYDVRNRGTDYYWTQPTDSWSVSTDWLSQQQASWLSELIESPNVYLQIANGFAPIVITNASYVHNTNAKSQKNFQYEIEYQFANQRRGR